ncbi:MAG TPA: ABC transporter permease, partial [Candidatus Polarisedimenticolia bacterium]|nr:ABC transporter permease [Candidatus Polarisedimenticolia bacterium]
MTDLKFGLRQMTKHPVFTAVAVITLALGIGANTAVFSVVHAVLLRPLPYGDPDRLAWVWGANPKNGIPHETASAPDFLDWKDQNQVFQDMGAYHGLPAILTGSEEPERFLGAATTPNLLPLLRVPPLMGRLFTDEDAKPGAVRVAILSHGLWQRRFGGDSSILGRTITLNGAPATVVGVMPAGFFLPVQSASRHAEIITPLHLDPERMGRRSDFLGVIARLRDGVTLQAAGTEMEGIAARLAGQYPATNTNWSTIVLGLHERFFGESRPVLRVLLGAVLFLLLIACANIANLLLARAAARRKELSIRAALGAG